MNLIVRACIAVSCGLTVSCGSVNPSTPDSTAPSTNLLIKRAGAPDLEVQTRSGPAAPVAANLGTLPPNGQFDFSVLATATDSESGIRELKLSMTKMVCYRTSAGNVAQAYSATVTRKQASYPDPKQVPSQASVGDTGVIDNRQFAIANPSPGNLLVWVNANQVSSVGIGVLTRWSMEAKNAAGLTSYSNSITIGAGDTSCGPLP